MQTCLNCSQPLGRNKKFCSNQCQTDFQYKTYVEDWLNGKEDGSRAGVLVSKHIRRYLKEIRGEVCEQCGWAAVNPYTGTVPVHLDHIDGDYTNNHPDNLRLLCPNCHSLTATYGTLNQGKGRPFGVYKR